MLNNRDGTNERPRERVATQSQGTKSEKTVVYSNSNANGELKQSHSRYDKGMELYKEGKVKVGSNGLFKVSGYYEADTEKMTCTCPDYRTRKESCKHLFAAMLFVKNRGKQKIEGLNGHTTNVGEQIPQGENLPTGGQVSKPFDRQATITRLAVLNTAVELLKTHRTPLEPETVISVAAQLEKWALGGEA